MKKASYSNKEYTKSCLPLTRKMQFFDWLKIDAGIFFKIGLALFLCALPMLLVLTFKQMFIASLPPAEDIETMVSYGVYSGIFDLGVVITTLVLSIGIAGVSRVYRLMSWNEPTMFKSDFFQGVKDNYKNSLIVCIIISVSHLLISYGSNIVGIMFESGIIASAIKWSLYAILLFVLLPTLFMSISMNSYYSNKFSGNFKNSFKICAHHYFPIVILPILALALTFLFYIPNPFILFAVISVIVLVILPIALFAWRLLCLSYFDKYINVNYIDILNKGLRKEGASLL